MNRVVFLVSHVGMNVFLHVQILKLIVGPFLFHNPTLVLSQCTILLSSLWLLYVYLLVLLSGVGNALFPDFYPKIVDYQVEIDCTTAMCP